MVSNVTIGSALTDAQQTQAAEAKLADDFAQFLTLLTVQSFQVRMKFRLMLWIIVKIQ